VLSGGASLGAMQAGMLQALYECDIRADLLVATSAGGLNAAFLASRPQTVQTAARLAGIWRDLAREDVFPVSLRALVCGLMRREDHLVPHRALRELLPASNARGVAPTDFEHAGRLIRESLAAARHALAARERILQPVAA
jgi:predicted acylesterase/phospholipase RssA